MKIDSEPIYAHATLATIPDSKIFSYENNTVETGWKVNNEIMETEICKVVSDGDIKKRETSPDALLSRDNFGHVKSLPRLQNLLFVDNLLSADAKETKDPLASNSVKVSEDDAEFFTDKAVTELELPEFMVCFKEFEDDYRVVKDICIDDGHPSVSTILIQDGEICDEGSFSSVQSELDENDDFTEETTENTAPVLNFTNPFVECDDKPDLACTSAPEISGGNSENYIEETENVENEASIFNVANPWVEFDSERVVAEKFNSQSFIENEDAGTDTPSLNLTNPFLEDSEADVVTKSFYESSIEHQVDLDDILDAVSDESIIPEKTSVFIEEMDASSSPEPSNVDQHEDQKQSDQGTSKEEHLLESITPATTEHSVESITPASTEEADTCEPPNTEPSESANISSDIDSSLPETSGREEEDDKTETMDPLKPVTTLNMPSIDEETADIRSTSSRSFFIQHGFGESSFSATGPLSGPLQIGSISLRSDSSTTSTRSFAFPVLNTEWSSSPVRMAKPDRSQFRKHRGWRMALLCCRF